MNLNNSKMVIDRKEENNLQRIIGKAGRDVNKLTGNIKSIGSAVNLESLQKGQFDPSLKYWERKRKGYSD